LINSDSGTGDSMKRNKVRQRMEEGKVALGSGINIAEPAIMEILGLAGFDCVRIDLEHSALDLGQVQDLIRAAEVVGTSPWVRVPDNDPKLILRLLDMGIQGVLIPGVQTAEEAQKAVNSVRYRPLGERGAYPVSRAAQYGAIPWSEHVRTSNEEIMLTVLIEDDAGMANLEAIASVEGVDFVSLGPSDLAEQMGVREPNHPKVRAAVDDAARRLKKVGKARMAFYIGHHMLDVTIADLKEWSVGFVHVLPNSDRLLLHFYKDLLTKMRAEAQ
jgi:2-keto-3-deoxy-L-rhamnonate aldolase RhmA